jgi:integrase
MNVGQVSAGVIMPTFGQVISRFELEAMPSRYSTKVSYKSMLATHIKPRWSDVPLGSIKTMVVEDWVGKLKLAPKTRRNVKALMSRIFTCCQRWELLDKNPIEHVELKGGSQRLSKPEIVTQEQFELILDNLKEPYRTMALLTGCLGLRISEVMGLRWTDIDFDEGTLLIQRGVVHSKHTSETKTEASRDLVPLYPTLVQALKAYRPKCHETTEQWLFASPITRRPYHQGQACKTHLKTAATDAGIPFRVGWHTFRHSYRVWLETAGATMTEQKELLRHSSIQTTMNTYGRAVAASKREVNGKVVERLLQTATNAA